MLIQQVNNYSFWGLNFKLSKATVKNFEKTTGLSFDKLTGLPSEELTIQLKQKETLKAEGKIMRWMKNLYKSVGEKLGLFEKPRDFYTDID